jgi:hypothetical protein
VDGRDEPGHDGEKEPEIITHQKTPFVPAKAGAQSFWIPACAGMNGENYAATLA